MHNILWVLWRRTERQKPFSMAFRWFCVGFRWLSMGLNGFRIGVLCFVFMQIGDFRVEINLADNAEGAIAQRRDQDFELELPFRL